MARIAARLFLLLGILTAGIPARSRVLTDSQLSCKLLVETSQSASIELDQHITVIKSAELISVSNRFFEATEIEEEDEVVSHKKHRMGGDFYTLIFGAFLLNLIPMFIGRIRHHGFAVTRSASTPLFLSLGVIRR